MSETVRYIVDKRAEMEKIKRLKGKKIRSARFGGFLFFVSLPFAFVGMVFMALGYWEFFAFALLPLVIFGTFLAFYLKDSKNKTAFYQLRDEMQAETIVDKFVQTMPDDFSYVKDFSVLNDKGEFHIDLAIFSRNGAFALTVVNAHGDMKSKLSDPDWEIALNNAKGHSEIFTIENPCPYAADVAMALEDMFRESRQEINVYPILYLSGCKLRGHDNAFCDGVYIVQNSGTASGDIVRYIDSFMGGTYINPEAAAEFIYPKEVRPQKNKLRKK